MKNFVLFVACLLLLLPCASAHQGRTDGSGGHWDYSADEYHYHHGYPAHQHEGGVCPYDYDDQTGATSGSSGYYQESGTDYWDESEENVAESSEQHTINPNSEGYIIPEQYIIYESSEDMEYVGDAGPEGFPYKIKYTIPPGSYMIDRDYYVNENGFIYDGWMPDDPPHGDIETDNSRFAGYDTPYIGTVVYQYGLENQSRQFQEGVTFGLHEAINWYDAYYKDGYTVGYNVALSEASGQDTTSIYNAAYNEGYDDARAEAYEAGYADASVEAFNQGYGTAKTDIQESSLLSPHDETTKQFVLFLLFAMPCVGAVAVFIDNRHDKEAREKIQKEMAQDKATIRNLRELLEDRREHLDKELKRTEVTEDGETTIYNLCQQLKMEEDNRKSLEAEILKTHEEMMYWRECYEELKRLRE